MRRESVVIAALVVMLPACSGDQSADTDEAPLVLLETGFEERISAGWACHDSPLYAGLDSEASFRVQVFLPGQTVDFPVDIADGAFIVYSGINMIPDDTEDKCDDIGGSAEEQRVDYAFEAVSGMATMHDDSGMRWVSVDSLILTPNNTYVTGAGFEANDVSGLEDITIDSAELPAVPINNVMSDL